MIDISWIRWHIYNFVVCKYNDNKQSESESDCRQRQMYRTKHKAGDSFLAQMEPHNGEEELDCGPKSSFQMRASFVFHLETKVLESGGRVEKLIAQVAWSPVLSFHSLWWFGCNVICWCRSIVFFENQRHFTRLPRNIGALHASFCWPAFLRCWFHFPAGFGSCPHCQKHQKMVKWAWCCCAWLASKLTRPEHRESVEYCREENEKQETKTCRWAEGHCQRNLGFTPPQQCHKLITSMPRRIEAVIKAEGAATKYWVHIQ